MLSVIAVLLAAFGAAAPVRAQFGCSSDLYISQLTGTTVTLYTINRFRDPYTLEFQFSFSGNYNGLGYNPADNFLYIVRNDGAQILRLGPSGQVLSIPAAVPNTINSAGFNAQGTMFISSNSNLLRVTGLAGGSAGVTTVTAFQADPAAPAGYTGAAAFLIGDMAVSRNESTANETVLYGTRSGEGGVVYLYRIRVTNANTGTPTAFISRIPTSLPDVSAYGSFWLDSNNRALTFNNGANADVGLYRVNLANGAATNVNGASPVSNSDGASCVLAPPLTEPQITLRKVTSDAVGGPFGFTLSNVGQPTGTVTTVVQATPVTVDGDTANPGLQPFTVSAFTQPVTITENPPNGWTIAGVECTDNGVVVGTRTGNSYTIPGALMVSSKEFVCTFTNRRPQADLALTKTNTIAAGFNDQADDTLVSGAQTTYTLRVTNNGPDSVTGAIVRDIPTGLNCPDASPVTVTGSGIPAGTSTIGRLKGAGVTLGTLPAQETAILTFVCTVD